LDLFSKVTLFSGKEHRGMSAVLLTRMKVWWDTRAQARSETGSNLVEYMLLLVLIAVIVVVVVSNIGSTLSAKYSNASSQLHP
jgi:Flp pilus assembly pilin Flp